MYIQNLGRRMRVAIAAGDIADAADYALSLADLGELEDEAVVRRELEGVDLSDLTVNRLLRALDGTDTVEMNNAVGHVAAVLVGAVPGAFWLGVLKELAAGVLRTLTPTPRIVPSVMRKAARKALERYYRRLRDEDC
jgi:hypothetical protein